MSFASQLTAGFERKPMFDHRAAPIYCLLAGGLSASNMLLWVLGFSFQDTDFFVPSFAVLSLLVSGWLARRIGLSSVGGACECTALIYSQAICIGLAGYPLTALSGPLRDAALIAADSALGFDWNAYAQRFNSPGILKAATWAYNTFNWQPMAVIAVLFATGNDCRAFRFVAAAVLSLIATMAIYPFFPAVGPFTYFHVTEFPPFPGESPVAFVQPFLAVRGGLRVITPEMTLGVIAMPSYHAAAATLFVLALWPLRWLRWPAMGLNLALCASALVVGGHYLIDLIVGSAVATASFVIAARPVANRSMSASLVPS